MDTRDIIAIGGMILTGLLAVFFWFTVWFVVTESVGWFVGIFSAIVSFVVLGVLAAIVITKIADWAGVDL